MRPAPARWLSRVKGVVFLRLGQAETARHAGTPERSHSITKPVSKNWKGFRGNDEGMPWVSIVVLPPTVRLHFVCKQARAIVEQAVWCAWEARCVLAHVEPLGSLMLLLLGLSPARNCAAITPAFLAKVLVISAGKITLDHRGWGWQTKSMAGGPQEVANPNGQARTRGDMLLSRYLFIPGTLNNHLLMDVWWNNHLFM